MLQSASNSTKPAIKIRKRTSDVKRPGKLKTKKRKFVGLQDMPSLAYWERIFESRKTTIMKKAKELELSCGVKVSVSVHSPTGLVYYYASNSDLVDMMSEGGLLGKHSINMNDILNARAAAEKVIFSKTDSNCSLQSKPSAQVHSTSMSHSKSSQIPSLLHRSNHIDVAKELSRRAPSRSSNICKNPSIIHKNLSSEINLVKPVSRVSHCVMSISKSKNASYNHSTENLSDGESSSDSSSSSNSNCSSGSSESISLDEQTSLSSFNKEARKTVISSSSTVNNSKRSHGQKTMLKGNEISVSAAATSACVLNNKVKNGSSECMNAPTSTSTPLSALANSTKISCTSPVSLEKTIPKNKSTPQPFIPYIKEEIAVQSRICVDSCASLSPSPHVKSSLITKTDLSETDFTLNRTSLINTKNFQNSEEILQSSKWPQDDICCMDTKPPFCGKTFKSKTQSATNLKERNNEETKCSRSKVVKDCISVANEDRRNEVLTESNKQCGASFLNATLELETSKNSNRSSSSKCITQSTKPSTPSDKSNSKFSIPNIPPAKPSTQGYDRQSNDKAQPNKHDLQHRNVQTALREKKVHQDKKDGNDYRGNRKQCINRSSHHVQAAKQHFKSEPLLKSCLKIFEKILSDTYLNTRPQLKEYLERMESRYGLGCDILTTLQRQRCFQHIRYQLYNELKTDEAIRDFLILSLKDSQVLEVIEGTWVKRKGKP